MIKEVTALGDSSSPAVYISHTDVEDALCSDRIHPDHLVSPTDAATNENKYNLWKTCELLESDGTFMYFRALFLASK